jgi:hypothetical protein
MKALVKIKFLKIRHFTIDETLLKKTPQLEQATKDTLKKLCETIIKYFKKNKIQVEADFELLGFENEKKA